ncbi:Lrp/AsnC family transcriptional regulator [Robiginitomaculum antarcticum]|uniref:Lrp/AsnC family transcriptional regulator n=1 Tax=Robiginitomaculum antarcticum TaxID=437507 RepID=UPI0004774C01|nr:Lrp/AsnC family transcriptional regulator [Robiginitomaculum antarcticum]
MSEKIDDIDIQILKHLQSDSSQSLDSLAQICGVSINTCWRRVQRLERDGIIERRVALIDNDKVGLPLTVFVAVKTDDHSAAWAEKFRSAVDKMPEIVEFYRLAGEVDYILKIMVASVADYDRVYQRLITKVSLADVSASFAMEKLKFTTELPLPPT